MHVASDSLSNIKLNHNEEQCHFFASRNPGGLSLLSGLSVSVQAVPVRVESSMVADLEVKEGGAEEETGE